MLDSFMLRSGYGELARAIHSSFASITTVFLLTRIWARKSQHKGLWWDDWLLVAAWICLLIGNGSNAAAPSYGKSSSTNHLLFTDSEIGMSPCCCRNFSESFRTAQIGVVILTRYSRI